MQNRFWRKFGILLRPTCLALILASCVAEGEPKSSKPEAFTRMEKIQLAVDEEEFERAVTLLEDFYREFPGPDAQRPFGGIALGYAITVYYGAKQFDKTLPLVREALATYEGAEPDPMHDGRPELCVMLAKLKPLTNTPQSTRFPEEAICEALPVID